jgi:hypothetical protein
MRRKLAQRRESSGWPAWIPGWPALLSVLPVLTIVLTLIGYGYDLAYLEAFGLKPQMLEHGPLDFLLRATYGLLPLIDKSTALKELLSTTEGLTRIWRDTEWMRYVGAAVALALLLLAIAAKEFAGTAPFKSRFLMRAVDSAHRLKTQGTRTVGGVSKAWRFVIGSTTLGWLAPPVMSYLLLATLWFMGSLVLLALTAAPIVGIAAGKAHARKLVIEPAHCSQRSGTGEITKDGAPCVSVLKDGKELARGRLIDQTSSRIWLLRKQPWAVVAIPLEGAVIEYTQHDSPI